MGWSHDNLPGMHAPTVEFASGPADARSSVDAAPPWLPTAGASRMRLAVERCKESRPPGRASSAPAPSNKRRPCRSFQSLTSFLGFLAF